MKALVSIVPMLFLVLAGCSDGGGTSTPVPFSHDIVGSWTLPSTTQVYTFGSDQRLTFEVTSGACEVDYSYAFSITGDTFTLSDEQATANDESVCETVAQGLAGIHWRDLNQLLRIFDDGDSVTFSISGSTLSGSGAQTGSFTLTR